MTDLSEVRALADSMSLSEASVDGPGAVEALAALKASMLSVEPANSDLGTWLSDEHFAGGVLLTAATMNKRAELAGKGNPFNRQSRSVLIERFNRWARQLVERIDAVEAGTAAPGQFLSSLARFKTDPIRNEP